MNVAAGDIVTVWEKGKQYKIRLYGIDTPELKQKFGPKAKKYISDVVFNKDLTVIQKDIDKYGTIVGMIYIADKCLNEALVKNGVAWVYKKYCREDFCNNWLQLEQEARENKLGLWSDDKPIPPWEFLKRQSKQHNNQ
ncbi:MAG: thermonuclease family protein [Desulfobacteraceae bacterium]|nr:thermonuclease family protein [Desulfobacteraceae bacterium]